jgi:hypothetical protein
MTTPAARQSGQVVRTMATWVPCESGGGSLECVDESSIGEWPAAASVKRFYDAYLYNRRPMTRATATGDRRITVRISGLGPARMCVGASFAITE